MAVRHFNWLAKLIIWSGISERGASCVLCHLTMTSLATVIALYGADTWTKAGYIVVGGVLFDLCKLGVDRLIGRPTAALPRGAFIGTTEENVVAQCDTLWKILLFVPMGIMNAVGMLYTLGTPKEGGKTPWLLSAINEVAPNLASVSRLIRAFHADVRASSFPQRVMIASAFTELLYCLLFAAVVMAIAFGGKAWAVVIARDARRKGFRQVSDVTPIVPVWILCCVVLYTVLLMLISGTSDICSRSNLDLNICSRNSFFLEYSSRLSLIAPCLMAAQAYLEAGCYERVQSNNKQSSQ